MPTVKLIPSSYYVSSSYLSLTNEENMYSNISSTTYATLTNTNASTSYYYFYLRGFNIGDIPANAQVSSFTIRIRGRASGAYNSAMYLSHGTTTISNATATQLPNSTTVTTRTFNNGSLTWADIVGYGSDFGIRVNCRRNAKNTQSYYYIYGAEIEVTYSLPVFYDIIASTNSGTISPAGTTSVQQGDNYTLTIDVANPTVTDNNVNITSQLVEVTGGSQTLVPNDYTNTGFTLSDIANAYTDASSTTSATLTLAGRTTGTLYLDLETLNIPSGATIESVSCQATLQFSRNGSSSSVTASCQMYSGSTAKGSATTIVSSATDVAKTTYNLNVGTWTASEIANARFYITEYNGASSTQRIMYVYGVSFSVTYSIDGVIYTYTINNVQGNHTIVVTAGAVTKKFYFKETSTTWTGAIKVWVKTSATTWTEQTVLDNVFDTNTNYIQGN